MKEFKFYDQGLKDFIREEDGCPLKKEFASYEEADEFVAKGGLDDYGCTNQGTKLWVDEDQE